MAVPPNFGASKKRSWRSIDAANPWFHSGGRPSTQDTMEVVGQEQQPTHVKPKYSVIVTESPKFDLPSYISNYRGRTVFRRLYLIASCSIPLQQDAARLAVNVAKSSSDIDSYQDAVQLLAQLTGKDAKDIVEKDWLARQEKQNAGESKRLENELKQYKNNLIRESIRMGSEELGVHNHNTGDLANALKSFNRMRDYCTTPSHIATTALRTIAVNIEQKNWLGVQSQVTKLKSLQLKTEEEAKTKTKMYVAAGLYLMSSGEYRAAAINFRDIDFAALGDSYSEIISPNDVAIYGGLCALASMSRSELQKEVLDHVNFRSFLELEPHIRRAINYFCASKYSQCLDILESYRADYLLDIYLQEPLPSIYQKIRTKSIVQYFQPFSRVTLESMEQMFGTTSTNAIANGVSTNGASPLVSNAIKQSTAISPFRNELIEMIQTGALKARIDLEHNVLIAYEESQRAIMQQEALDTVDNFITEAQIKLLRLNAINGGLEVKPPPKSQGGKTGGVDIGSLVDSGSSGNFSNTGYSLRSTR